MFIPHAMGEVFRPDWRKFKPGKTVSATAADYLAFNCIATMDDGACSHFLDMRGEARRVSPSAFYVRNGERRGEAVLCIAYAPAMPQTCVCRLIFPATAGCVLHLSVLIRTAALTRRSSPSSGGGGAGNIASGFRSSADARGGLIFDASRSKLNRLCIPCFRSSGKDRSWIICNRR